MVIAVLTSTNKSACQSDPPITPRSKPIHVPPPEEVAQRDKEIDERRAADAKLESTPNKAAITNVKPQISEEDKTFIRQSENSFNEMTSGGYFKLERENLTARFDTAAWNALDVYTKKKIIARLSHYFELMQHNPIVHVFEPKQR